MIINFNTDQSVNLQIAGGKGLNLVQMTQAGLTVPDGYIVTTELYDTFIDENQLAEHISSQLDGLSASDMTALGHASRSIQQRIQNASLPEAISSQIVKAYKQLNTLYVAVRSSATAEDLPDMSFAGQHDSYLNVKGETELIQAVKDCWASLWNARAISYRLRHHIPQDFKTLSLAVVVQTMAESDTSGVMFTVNPLNNRRDEIFINASWGMGEAVVSGIVSPDQFILNKETGKTVSSTIATKDVQIIRTEEGNQQTAVPDHIKTKPSLSPDQLKQLYNLALAVDRYYNQPMDTEWVLGDGMVYIVQARPVTGLHPMPEVNDPPQEHGLRLYLSFTRVSQGISVPFTPLGIDVQRLEMWGALKALGIQSDKSPKWFKTAAGRIYWDFTELMRNPKRVKKMADSFALKDPVAGKVLMEFMERNKEELTSKKSKLKYPPKLFALGGRIGMRVIGAIANPGKAETRSKAIAQKNLNHMKRKARKAGTIEEKIDAVDTIMENGMRVILHQCAYMVPGLMAENRARRRLTKWLGDDSLLNPVIHALPNSPTTRMGHELVQITCNYKKTGKQPGSQDPEIQTFLKTFGHRSNVELDVGIPNWQEKPDYIMNLISSYMEQDTERLYEKLKKQENEAEKAVRLIRSKVDDVKGKRSGRKIEKDCRYIRSLLGLRELPKFDLIRSFALVRELLQKAGDELVSQGRIKTKNDVFFLQRSEILSPADSLMETVEARKKTYAEQKEIKTVPRFITNTGECLYGSTESTSSDNGLNGVPIASGEFTGIVRVIHDPAGAKLKDGEILVTHSTDPSWTPLFLSAGGLIMETGGTGSHGGIVAREYGIPAVAGIERVSEKLKTGDKVTVNGHSGDVIILDQAHNG